MDVTGLMCRSCGYTRSHTETPRSPARSPTPTAKKQLLFDRFPIHTNESVRPPDEGRTDDQMVAGGALGGAPRLLGQVEGVGPARRRAQGHRQPLKGDTTGPLQRSGEDRTACRAAVWHDARSPTSEPHTSRCAARSRRRWSQRALPAPFVVASYVPAEVEREVSPGAPE